MNNVNQPNQLPDATIVELDLSKPKDFEKWHAQMMNVARFRLDIQRERLVQSHIVSDQGEVLNQELPKDMRQDSKTSTDT
jgi:hypothetical protein